MNEATELEFKENLRLISKLTEMEKFCLNAYLVSGNKTLAYICSRERESRAKDKQTLYTLANKYFRKPEVQAYLKMRTNDLMNGNFIMNKDFIGEEKEAMIKEKHGENQDFIPCGSNELKGSKYLKESDNLEKDEALATIIKLFKKETDPKMKLDLVKTISDLKQWKKEVDTDDDNTVRFYLPLKCFNCKLYTDFKNKNRK